MVRSKLKGQETHDILLESPIPIPYLEPKVTEEFAQVSIKSIDNHEIRVNHLFLIVWSANAKEFLFEAFNNQEELIVISTDFNASELNQLNDFVTKGVLPCPKSDILDGKLSTNVNNVFKSFGIDLKLVLQLPKIKQEDIEPFDYKAQKAIVSVEKLDVNSYENQKISYEFNNDDFNDGDADFELDQYFSDGQENNSEEYSDDDEYKPLAKKRKKKATNNLTPVKNEIKNDDIAELDEEVLHDKPEKLYTTDLIKHAFAKSGKDKLTLNNIVDIIRGDFPYYAR